MDEPMACPYLREVVMLSCDAFPVKKMLPLDRITTGEPCSGHFHVCPFFQERTARLVVAERDIAASTIDRRKDGAQ
jgi:hypothetical protein